MESYYSSDEDIACGTLTLREVKRELKKQSQKISHRKSDFGNYPSLEIGGKSTATEDNKSNSSGTSAYFTPNESLQPDPLLNKNEVFLEKLTKVIEGEPNEELETSSYVSALDTSKIKQPDDTLMKILNFEDTHTNNLDNIQQSLVENTIQFSPCNNSRIVHHNSTIQELSESDSDDEIIVITDNSSDESVEHIYEPEEHLVKRERGSGEVANKTRPEEIQELEDDTDDSDDIADLLLELQHIREKQKTLGSLPDNSCSEELEDNHNEKHIDHEIDDSVELQEDFANSVSEVSSENSSPKQAEKDESKNKEWEYYEEPLDQEVEYNRSSQQEDDNSLNEVPVHHSLSKHEVSNVDKNGSRNEGSEDVCYEDLAAQKFENNHNLQQKSDTNSFSQPLEIYLSKDATFNGEYKENNHSHEESEDELSISVTDDRQKRLSSIIENDQSESFSLEEKVPELRVEEDKLSSEHEENKVQNYNEMNEKFKQMDLKEYGLNMSGVELLTNQSTVSKHVHERSLITEKSQSNEVFLENPAPSLASVESVSVSTDSGNKSESFVFNDTLEEMEMVLKQGLNLNAIENDVCDDKERVSTHSEPLIMKKPTGTVKKKPVKTPLKKFDYIQSPIGDYIRKQKSPATDNFKLPLKPLKAKLTPNPRSPHVQTRPFKNIVSPIGVYIKNSPGVCLKQNVSTKTVPSLKCGGPSEIVKSNKENISSGLPQVIYKPAKKEVASFKKEINLPPNIQKLVPEPIVIKHENRIKTPMDNSVVNKKLLEDDLTTTTVEGSLLGDDISFLTVQQAFIQ